MGEGERHVPGWLKALAIVGAVVGFLFGSRPLSGFATRHPTIAISVEVALVLALALFFVLRRAQHHGYYSMTGTFVFLAVVVGGAGWAIAIGYQDRSHGVVADYCHYGAVSQSQFKHCLEHVSESHIEDLDTNAAKFAKRELDECRSDAGPYCEDTLNWNLLSDEQ